MFINILKDVPRKTKDNFQKFLSFPPANWCKNYVLSFKKHKLDFNGHPKRPSKAVNDQNF